MFVRWMPKLIHTAECIDGAYEHLLFYMMPITGTLPDGRAVLPMFRTRQQCRAYITANYGYIRTREDLKRHPHGWRCPVPVKVTITPLEPINDYRSRLRSVRARDSSKSHTHPRRHQRKVRA